ncbi:RNA directed DNA polymerase (reverse transcriptase) [Brachionus plicatilis]|uniref:RNA directed DNA polymerase (Reverse transcriptase) n=1 Tax=Brachionus plicatilis TaxID=10195 RepID=A0A3M7SP19_BRAPC|nr:RNA directed DNA polymerase (reverse transcriptase) [Brachionus plicatilis]
MMLPRSLVPKIIKECHGELSGGHIGIKRTYAKIRQKYLWADMTKHIKAWINSSPEKLLSDQGRQLMSNLGQEICNYMRTKKLATAPYHSQTNRQTELVTMKPPEKRRLNYYILRIERVHVRRKTHYDEKRSLVHFKENDLVRINSSKIKQCLTHKLNRNKWKSPFKVKRIINDVNAEIEQEKGKTKIVYINRLNHAENLYQIKEPNRI